MSVTLILKLQWKERISEAFWNGSPDALYQSFNRKASDPFHYFQKMHFSSCRKDDFFFALTGTWEARMSLGVYDHLHTASPILTWSPLWVVVVVQRVVVVISVISKQTLNKASPQLYPNLYSVYKKYPGLETIFWTSNREKQKTLQFQFFKLFFSFLDKTTIEQSKDLTVIFCFS